MPSYYHFKEFFNRKSIPSSSKVFNSYLDCFFPYLHEKFQVQTVKDFVLWMLHDLDYRINRQAYSGSFLDEIQPYFRQTKQISELNQLKKFLVPQIINIDSEQEFFSALEAWYAKNGSVRILPFQDRRYALALKLKQDGCLEVFIHSSVFVIEKGTLTPLPPLTRLFYTPEFDLDTSRTHYIYHPPRVLFKVKFFNETNLEVYKMKFPSCVKTETLHIKKLEDHPELYSQLKMAENHFIKPKSDFSYQKLIQSLQNCYQLLLVNHPQAIQEAQTGLKEARQALKNYYSNDRLLFLLITNIEYHLHQKTKKTTDRLLIEKDPFMQDMISSDPF